jgi:hypothetical protein
MGGERDKEERNEETESVGHARQGLEGYASRAETLPKHINKQSKT